MVVTSSVAAVMSDLSRPAGTQYTEADWNEDSVKEVEKKGKDTAPQQSYRASKTLAEKALWGAWAPGRACRGGRAGTYAQISSRRRSHHGTPRRSTRPL